MRIKLLLLLLSITAILTASPLLAADAVKIVPVHKKKSWPVDIVSDMTKYSSYLEMDEPELSRSLRQASNRLKAARILYPEYPNVSTKRKTKRYQNCVPTIDDLKLLQKAASYYHFRSADKAVYASIYAMRLIGRGSERYWKTAPNGPISEMRRIINNALLTLNTNVNKKHPSRIPLILARAYYFLHTGREEKAYRMAKLSILLARKNFGKGSKQELSTIKYSSLIFNSTDRQVEFAKRLDQAIKESKVSKEKLTSKDDFYF